MIVSSRFESFDVNIREEHPIVADKFGIERARVVVIGPTPIEHFLDRDRTRDVRQAPHVIAVEVRDENVIETRWVVSLDVASDPFARSTGAVGSWRCVRGAAIGRGAGVDEQARPVGKDEKRRVPASGADVVDVEVAFAPGSQDLK